MDINEKCYKDNYFIANIIHHIADKCKKKIVKTNEYIFIKKIKTRIRKRIIFLHYSDRQNKYPFILVFIFLNFQIFQRTFNSN